MELLSIGDNTHMFARFALQLPKKCKNLPPAETTAGTSCAHHDFINNGMRVICAYSPTIDVLDAVILVFLDHCANILKEHDAVNYIKKEKYVEVVSRQILNDWRILMRSPTRESFYFSKAWIGLFSGFLPGFACGSQPVESFHALWERARLQLGGRESIMNILHTMQNLYQTDSAFTDLWNDSDSGELVCPTRANPDLLAGGAIRFAGLGPAIDS